jgi:hypothetical protein
VYLYRAGGKTGKWWVVCHLVVLKILLAAQCCYSPVSGRETPLPGGHPGWRAGLKLDYCVIRAFY